MVNERVYIHFDKLNQFVISELYNSSAKPLTWAICLSHINSLPQYNYRSDLSQPLNIAIEGLEYDASSLQECLDAVPHLISSAGENAIVLATEAISRLAATISNPIIIVRKPASTSTTTSPRSNDKKGWEYANNLFASLENAFYDYQLGNRLIGEAMNQIEDINDFCEWRVLKKRPAIPVTMPEVMKEYERFKAPEVDVSTMQLAPKPPAPVYRTVNLKKDDSNDG